jgi:hypothetical protein
MENAEIIIEPENYKSKRVDGAIFIYNSIYESRLWLLILTALLSVLSHDIRDMEIPVAIKILPKSGEGRIFIGRDFAVKGAADYQYFIPRAHYEKWKWSFLASWVIISLLALALDVLFIYLTICVDGIGRLVIGLVAILFIAISASLFRKIITQVEVRKKYPVRELFW